MELRMVDDPREAIKILKERDSAEVLLEESRQCLMI